MDPDIIQLKLNGFDACREMASDIALAYEQSDNVSASALHSDHHGPPLLDEDVVRTVDQLAKEPTLRLLTSVFDCRVRGLNLGSR